MATEDRKFLNLKLKRIKKKPSNEQEEILFINKVIRERSRSPLVRRANLSHGNQLKMYS